MGGCEITLPLCDVWRREHNVDLGNRHVAFILATCLIMWHSHCDDVGHSVPVRHSSE